MRPRANNMASPANREYETGVSPRRAGSTDLAEITGGRTVETQSPYRDAIGERACVASASVGRTFGEARRHARTYYADAIATTRYLATRTRRRALLIKEERPLQALGIIATAAFVCGVALRIWRSQNS